jgi:nitrite reductase/ring-hydroxylating ferredoxin subunit
MQTGEEVGMEFINVGNSTGVAAGTVKAFDVEGTRVAVANVGGSFYAFSDICTHMHCSLAKGKLEGTIVTCACHGSQFDVTTGAVRRGPAREPVRAFQVRIKGDSVQVEA